MPQIDWLRPPQPKDYIPWTPDQIIIGQQHYLCVIGDGESRSFQLAHHLDTSALHVSIRENGGPSRLLLPSEYGVTFPSNDEALIEFPATEPPPEMNAYAVTITAAGPKSAFQDHHHSIGQINELPEALLALGLRLTAIEDLLPAVNPAARSGATATALEIEIPDRSEMFPGKLAADTTAEAAEKDPTKLPKPAGLLPAIHDASIESITVPLPSAASGDGQVYRNDSALPLLVPGGLGRRGAYLDPLGYAGSDGRVWYSRSTSNCPDRSWSNNPSPSFNRSRFPQCPCAASRSTWKPRRSSSDARLAIRAMRP